jgi:hypothetical protein
MEKKPYVLLEAPGFPKAFSLIPREAREVFIKRIEHLRTDPYAVGKPLGVAWFRELKHKKYRVYYLIYDASCVVLLTDTSEKKDQERIIAIIRSRLPFFSTFTEEKGAENYKNDCALTGKDHGKER